MTRKARDNARRRAPAALSWSVAAACSVGLCAQARAAIDPETLAISAECEGVDALALGRALDLELKSLLRGSDLDLERIRPRFELRCAPTTWTLEVIDDLTDKSIARAIPAPSVLRERTAALAFSELLLASWLELIVADRSQTKREEERRARVAVDKRIGARLDPAKRDARRFIMSLGAGATGPYDGALLAGPQGRLLYRSRSRWSAGVTLERRAGRLRAGEERASLDQWTVGALALLRVACALECALRLDATASVAGGTTTLRGESSSAELEGRTVRGPHGQSSAGIAASWQWRWLTITLPASLLMTWTSPRGIADEARSVDALGPALLIGVELGAAIPF